MTNITLAYQGRSAGRGTQLNIAAASVPHAGAFCAPVEKPQTLRLGLLALGRIVRANFESMDYEEWLESVLDPIVGIHPDGISMEAFSRDGSTLGWIHLDNSVFGPDRTRRCGCTSIDFSPDLESYLQSLHPGSKVTLTIGTEEGVTLAGKHGKHREKRIEMPDDWMHGFGEMHAGLLATRLSIDMTRVDLLNIVRDVKRKVPAAMKGRALIFRLSPGERIQVEVQPWGLAYRMQAKVPPELDQPIELKLYGRRRLEVLDHLLSQVRSARLHVIGSSRPSYWELSMPGMRMILALSSWTARKFTKTLVETLRGANAALDNDQVRRAAAILADAELLSLEELAAELGCAIEQARAIGLALCRQGLALAEPQGNGLRWRPLHLFPLSEVSVGGVATERETNAERLLDDGKLEVLNVHRHEESSTAEAECEGRTGRYRLSLSLQPDGSFAEARCECAWMQRRRDGLRGGPCKHLLALRMAVMGNIEEETHHAGMDG